MVKEVKEKVFAGLNIKALQLILGSEGVAVVEL